MKYISAFLDDLDERLELSPCFVIVFELNASSSAIQNFNLLQSFVKDMGPSVQYFMNQNLNTLLITREFMYALM